MKTIKIEEPKVCPFCGSPIERILDEGAHIYCTNPNCSERKLAKLNYFVSKECMNIDGLSEKTLRKLVDNLNISNWYDLYKLTFDDFVAGGCGEKTALKLVDELSKSRISVSADKVLVALGIPMIGKVSAKRLLEKYGSIKEIEDTANTQQHVGKFVESHGYGWDILNTIGVEAGKQLVNYFRTNSSELQEVYKYLQYEYTNVSKSSSGSKLTGLVLMATGTLNNFTRDGIKDSVIDNGGTYAAGVSKKLNFLIVGDAPGASKISKATELGIKQITEDEYLNMLN